MTERLGDGDNFESWVTSAEPFEAMDTARAFAVTLEEDPVPGLGEELSSDFRC